MDKLMTAKELAEQLLKNPDDIVCITSWNFEHNNAWLPVQGVGIRFKGKLSKKTFRDAFDGGQYEKEVVELDDESDKVFIKL